VEIPEPRWVVINESQVCWVDRYPDEGAEAVLHMSNGDVMYILEPPYSDWENDTIA